jgi:hypothetical protein
MPCSDVTEEIRITIDKNDKLVSYELRKRTCGRFMGAPAVIADEVCGRNMDYILAGDDDTLLGEKANTKHARKFIALKHLLAIKSVLAAYRGMKGDVRNNACAIARIDYNGDNVIIDADIKIDMITEKIEACPGCAH